MVHGSTDVGDDYIQITGLSCCGTDYYARIRASNDAGETWFGPVTWSTDYSDD